MKKSFDMKERSVTVLCESLVMLNNIKLGAIMVTASLAACGGGGSPSPQTPSQTGNITIALNPQSTVVSAEQAGAMTTVMSADGQLQILTPDGSSLSPQLRAGAVVHVLPGQDERFPIGFAGKVGQVAVNGVGQTTATLEPASLVEVLSQSSVQTAPIALNSNNFVGAISPLAVRNAMLGNTGSGLAFYESGKVALNGAIVLQDESLARTVVNTMSGASVFGGDGLVNKDTIFFGSSSNPWKIRIADMGIEPSQIRPYGGKTDATFEVSGAITGLQVVENHETRAVGGVVTGLKSLQLRVSGTVNAKAELKGGISADLGYFSQAWKEVEEESFKALGVTAKLSGISSKEKIGKYPLTGLVFSVPCPSTCPVALGQTQTPLRAAKQLGLVVWVYLTAKGTIAVDGTVGLAKINNGQFSLGIDMPEGGAINSRATLTNAGDAYLIEAPYLDGDLDMNAKAGLSLDADFFVLGVHMANASMDMVGQLHAHAQGTAKHATRNLDQSWEWSGNACLNTDLGAGVIASAQLGVGVSLDTNWGLLSASVDVPPYTYFRQFPEEDRLNVPGRQGLWYASEPFNRCFPQPVVRDVTYSRTGQQLTVKVSGTGLPADLVLAVNDRTACTGLARLEGPSVDGSQRYTCTLPTCTAPFVFTPSSVLASNLDTGLVNARLRYAPPVNVNILSAQLQADNKVIVKGSSCPATNIAMTWPALDREGDASRSINATTDSHGDWRIVSFAAHPEFVGLSVQAVAYSADNVASPLASMTIVRSDLAVNCTPAVVGQEVVCTVTGSNLSGISVSAGSYGVSEDLGGSNTRRSWRFTPTSTTAVSFMVSGGGTSLLTQSLSVSLAYPTTPLTDTGITADQCYQTGSSILVSCTSIGATSLNSQQDGMVGRDVSNNDSSDGILGFSYSLVSKAGGGTYDKTECVKDNITGLMWEGKPSGGTRGNPALDPNGTYTNYHSVYYGTQAQMDAVSNTYGYVAAVNSVGLCGYKDWRLPTRGELQSLVDYGVAYPGPTIDSEWYPNSRQDLYGTSSSHFSPLSSGYAWYIHFRSGGVEASSRSQGHFVRLVR